MASGEVFLVGAGPGDPGLLTIKGQRLLSQADVVVYDYLVDEQMLSHACPRAELIPARDLHGNRAEQERINELLVECARQGKQVVRLKGGDPYLFGRGGEEGQALHAAGIHFEVVPGVSSALAAPAYAGIPLTHRDYSSSVSILTGQVQPDKDIDWQEVGRAGTLVFLMAMTNLADVVQGLIDHGRSPETPAAAIRWGTRPEQHTVTACLKDLPASVRAAGLKAPAVVVVGEVVRLRDQLAWFEHLPLFGVGILVTRTRKQAGVFGSSLREAGARVFQLPVIEVAPLPLPAQWDRLGADPPPPYDWIIFTSANGVEHFCRRLWAGGGDARWFGAARLCAIGPETARSLERYGLRADVVPGAYVAEAIVQALASHTPRKVLIPRAAVARDVLPEALRAAGAEVDVLEVYRTDVPEGGAGQLRDLLASGQVDAVTFTSSSTVRNFMHLAGKLPVGIKVACIGPITRQTAEEHGLSVDITAETYTTTGLKDALVAYYSSASGTSRKATRS